MFERFSGGYYLGRLYVEPYGGERAVMQRGQHERVNEQLYVSDEGIERLDTPLVMKFGTRHFPVHGDGSIPADTLALPTSMVEGCRLDSPPELREVLLATADRAGQLLSVAGARSKVVDAAFDTES
jgi:hypothetical protein